MTDEQKKPPPKKSRKDGAQLLAEELVDRGLSKVELADAIAVELRKAAQGPRKWGVLR